MKLYACVVPFLVLNLNFKLVLSEYCYHCHRFRRTSASHRLNGQSCTRGRSSAKHGFNVHSQRDSENWGRVRGGAAAPSTQAAEGFDWDDAIVALQSIGYASRKLWTKRILPFCKHRVLPVLRELESHVVEPLQDYLHNQTQETPQGRRNCVQQRTSNLTAVGAGAALALWPRRLVKVFLLAWVLAESFTWFGALSDDELAKSIDTLRRTLRALVGRTSLPTQWNQGVRQKWKDARKWWRSVQKDPSALWTTLDNRVAPRYQWTLGAAAGLLFAPPLRAVLSPLATLGVYAFLLGETNRLLRGDQRRYWADAFQDPEFDESLMQRLEDALETWSQLVQRTIEHPKEALDAARARIHSTMHTDWKVPQSVENGLIVGLVIGLIGAL